MVDRRALVAGILLISASGACGRGGASAPEAPAPLAAAAAVPNVRLVATLQPFNSPVLGEASLTTGRTAGEMQASVKIRNSVVGLEHRWQIRRGDCGTAVGNDVAPTSANSLLRVTADGTASITATLPVTLPVDGQYHLSILRSRSDDTVIACGVLEVAR
ncbi:MAG: hypothetical protein ACYC2G_04845 [Gemmatimonadaceae bacterium]